MKRAFRFTLAILAIAVGLTGCSPTITSEEGGPSIRSGTWSASSEEGEYSFQANVVNVNDSETVLSVLMYSYPCGNEFTYVMPPQPIKLNVLNGGFEARIEQTILAGQFIDGTHAQGTWEVLAHQIPYLDKLCSAAKGTWEGRPE